MLPDLERRSVVELRADRTRIVGYAVVFDTRSRDLGGFVEVVRPAAVDRALEPALTSSRSTTMIPAPCSAARRRR